MSQGSLETTPRSPPKSVAVIDIGTTSIRMAVADIDDRGGVHTLETLNQGVSLGKDAFTKGRIAKSTIEECVQVLRSYKEKLREFQITQTDKVRVVATSAVREASNRLAFIDRIYIATGFQVDPIDEAEETRITYLGIVPFLRSESALAAAKAVVIEVGGGNTEMLVVRNTNVLYSHSYRLGSLRLRETLEAYHAPAAKLRELMKSQIDRTVQQIREQVWQEGSIELVALGGDIRLAASVLVPGWNPKKVARVPVAALEVFTNEILELTEDELVRTYPLSYPDADTLGPALLTYVRLAKAFDLVNIVVTDTNLRDGLLKEMASGSAWTEDFSRQIIRSAQDLGRRFHFDEQHAQHVAELTSTLFKQLQSEHRLEPRYATILYVAALLHEIGLYVAYPSHHKHAMYLIRNSELFGLGRKDVLLTALVARYYRRASPQPTHEGYNTLTRDERVIVSKLAAILRIAVALSDARNRRIKELACQVKGNRLIMTAVGVRDVSLEQLALRQNATLFEDVFGLQVQLRPQRG